MCPFRPPLQPRQLARVDERAPREHHQEGSVPGTVPHRGQQAQPEAAVERRQALLPVGRREPFLSTIKLRRSSGLDSLLYLFLIAFVLGTV